MSKYKVGQHIVFDHIERKVVGGEISEIWSKDIVLVETPFGKTVIETKDILPLWREEDKNKVDCPNRYMSYEETELIRVGLNMHQTHIAEKLNEPMVQKIRDTYWEQERKIKKLIEMTYTQEIWIIAPTPTTLHVHVGGK